jgi:hypothetical protein
MTTPRRPLQEISNNSTIRKKLSLYQGGALVGASKFCVKQADLARAYNIPKSTESLRAVPSGSPFGLPCIFCRFMRHTTPQLSQHYIVALYSIRYSDSIKVNLQVQTHPAIAKSPYSSFSLRLRSRALALALAPGAGMRPWSICHCCGSMVLDAFLTQLDRRSLL